MSKTLRVFFHLFRWFSVNYVYVTDCSKEAAKIRKKTFENKKIGDDVAFRGIVVLL
ncbi:MAG: hypothetical protein IKH61_03980 [Bacteroidales bacterium]|nr:hypothetical protein [Bacteroidales bacterium]